MMDERARRIALECKGFMHEEEGLRLHELAREHARLGPLVEIGSYCGKSAVYPGTLVMDTTSRMVMYYNNPSSVITNSTPVTWAASDFIRVKFNYEAA